MSATGGGTDRELLRRYHADGDLEARQRLIEQYLPLVRSLARRYANRGEQLEDLVQVGSIGLIKAIDRFDVDRGVELTTYATPNIIGEIKRHFRDKGWSVRVPRGLQELNVRLSQLLEQLTVQYERSPTIPELAKAAGRHGGGGPGGARVRTGVHDRFPLRALGPRRGRGARPARVARGARARVRGERGSRRARARVSRRSTRASGASSTSASGRG